MKTAEEMMNEIISELDNAGYSRDYFKGFVEEKLREYGAQVREACAQIAERSYGEPQTSDNVRKLELP